MKLIRSIAVLCAAALLCLGAASCAGEEVPAKSSPESSAAVSSKSSEKRVELEKMSVGLRAAKCRTTLSGRSRDGIRLELSYVLKFNADTDVSPMGLEIVFPQGTSKILGTDSSGTRNLSLPEGQRELKGTDVSEFYPDNVTSTQLQELLSPKTPYTVNLHMGETVIRRQVFPSESAGG